MKSHWNSSDKAKTKKGFTLIELLIVVAILSILATLILAAVNSSRNKAYDAQIRNGVGQLRWLAEIAYDTQGGSYVNWTQLSENVDKIDILLRDIDKASGDDTTDETFVTITTESQASDYCISAALRTDESQHYCIDRSGLLKTVSSPCPTDDPDGAPLVCPGS